MIKSFWLLICVFYLSKGLKHIRLQWEKENIGTGRRHYRIIECIWSQRSTYDLLKQLWFVGKI